MATTTTAVVNGGNNLALTSAILTVHSPEILMAASPITRFDQVVSMRTELGVTQGRTIQFLKYAALSNAAADLTEATAMTPQSLVGSTVSITVAEKGVSVEVTELLLRTSFDDVMSTVTRQLGQSYASKLDSDIRDAVLTCSHVLYANGKTTRAGLTASDKLNVDLILDTTRNLKTRKAPKIPLANGDQVYVCFAHPHQLRDLKDDSRWQSITAYASPGNFLRGEVGRIDDVLFIETTQMPYVDTSGNVFADATDTTVNETGGSVTVYKAAVLGDYAVGLGVGLPVELRDDGVIDHGRKHRLAWYSIYGAGVLEEGHIQLLETA